VSRRSAYVDGFKLEQIDLPEATLRVGVGGKGEPILLLHGHPRTHAIWHRVAPILAKQYTVVCLKCYRVKVGLKRSHPIRVESDSGQPGNTGLHIRSVVDLPQMNCGG
jgi:hypothetical protein